MKGNISRARAGLLAVILFAAVACGQSQPETASGEGISPDPLVLGFLPSQSADSSMPDARRLGDFLAAQMGRAVEVVIPSTYEPLIEGLRFGHVHAAFLDGGPGWIAHERSGAEVILAEVQNGNTYYWAEAFTRAGSGIDSLSDVRGKRVAFTSRTGSSGFLMPIGSLIRAGVIQPAGSELSDLETALDNTFESTIDAGGYRQALVALLDGRADIAFGAHDAPERFLEPEQRTQLVSFHRFGRIPSHSVMVSAQLSPDVVNDLRDAMLALNDSANLPLLRAIYGVDGLVEATTADHLGDFGRALSALPGMQRTLLSRAD